jgi:hypothetical protein
MLRQTDSLSLVSLALFVALVGGCASKTQGEKTIESYAHTRETLSDSRRQVALTSSSLTSLRTTPPQALKDAFRRYKDAVGQLEKEAADSKWRAQAMQEQSDAHIQAWQEEMKTIKDPTIKASVESRRDAVGTNFSLIRMYADDVRKAYEPFLQGNKDMLQALSLDLSPAAITSLSEGIDKVVASGKALDDKLWSMEHAMDNVANGKSPLGGTP